MKTGFRFLLLTVTLLMVFVFNAMLTVPAYADDSIPPPTETPTEATPPVDESTPAAIDPALVTEETVSAEETAPEPLTQVPEGTDVVVVNEEGEAVPLVTQEAADAIGTGDPVWCPTGVSPKTDGSGGCTTSYGSLKLLVDNLMAGTAGVVPSKNGVIWIESGPDASAGGILLNGNDLDLGAMKTFTLTLQGGWNGVHGSSSVSLLTPSTFTQSLSIINWQGAITLNNITFSGVTVGSATNSAALNVQTAGKITLTNVRVNSNTGAGTVNGAWLDNADADLLVLGDVSITNSQFNDNKNVGLTVNSEGAITLANVLVNGNDAGGAYLKNTFAASAKAVAIVTGTNEFSSNGGTGLDIFSIGAVTLKDITANGNSNNGATVNNWAVATAQAVTLTGTNVFSDNTNSGLIVDSRGVISANSVIANNNVNGWGAQLTNTYAATAPQAVKLTGNNEFKFNGYGLYVRSQGAITTNNVAATNNTIGQGVALSNNYNFAFSVTMAGANVFTDNAFNGLEVLSKGSITLNNITANGNGLSSGATPDTDFNGYGAYLDNTQALTPMTVILNGINTFNNNYDGGVEIHSKGVVTLSKITANDSIYGSGVFIYNDLAVLPKAVTLTGYGVFNHNYWGGLGIVTKGAITLNNVTANENHNLPNTDGGTGVYLYNAITPESQQNITLKGTNEFNGNYYYGLYVNTNGAVLMNNITTNDNTNGAYIYNATAALLKTVTLTGYGVFNNNKQSGLWISSKAAVTLNNVTANDNGQFGSYIYNPLATLPQAVTLNGYGIFNNNVQNGLWIQSKGAITLNNLTANNNTAGDGVRLNNLYAPLALPQNITINGTNTFSGNFGTGLRVETLGTILTNNLTANDNGGDGAYLKNWIVNNITFEDIITLKAVTLNGVNVFNGNNFNGLTILSTGMITVSKLDAGNNLDNGAYLINNVDPAVSSGVNITGWVYANNNGNDGLYISSTGTISVSKLDASNNLGYGALLNNDVNPVMSYGVNITGWVYADNNGEIGLAVTSDGNIAIANLNINKGGSGSNQYGAVLNSFGGNVTISGASQIFDCVYAGLQIQTDGGAVTLSNMTVSGNGGLFALLIDTRHAGTASPQNVTLTGVNTFWNNDDIGLGILTYGAISISNIDAYNNGAVGVYLDNCGAQWNGGNCNPNLGLAPKGITITGSNFFEKNGGGISALSFGAISVSNLHATDNDGHGAYLNNQWEYATSGITLTGVNTFTNNGKLFGESGLVVLSNAAIIMSNVTASNNGLDGVSLDNHGLTGTTAVAVSLTGVNTFTNNGTTGAGSGLVINAGGQITLSNVTASGNQASGASLNNFTNTSALVLKPGVKLTGLNIFNQNIGTGLDILSRGAIDLVHITADDNGADGIHANTLGAFTLACGSMNNNSDNGWDLTGSLITLKGVFGFGNAFGNFTSPTPVIVRACPVPAPLVIPPKDDSDEIPHGSNRTPPVYDPYRRD